jgi:hypothetical protein
MAEKRLKDLDLPALTAGRTFNPSPSAWEDQVLYFLMLDRFSDGKEKNYRGNSSSRLPTMGTRSRPLRMRRSGMRPAPGGSAAP